MSAGLVVSHTALSDVTQAMDFIARDSFDHALRFHEAVCHTFQNLTDSPLAGAIVEGVPLRLRGLRKWPVHGFVHYAVYYLPTSDSIDVVRVLHGARNVQRILRGMK